MTDDRSESQELKGLLGALLSPLRAPQRVVADIETIAAALLSLQRDVRDRLISVDESAGELVHGVGTLQDSLGNLQAPVDRMDLGVKELAKLEQVITERMDALQAPLDRLDVKVAELATLEQAITERMDAIDEDLNTRMLAVEQEVHAMRAPIEQMARDVSAVKQLLPEPGDGPLARLKDTFTPS